MADNKKEESKKKKNGLLKRIGIKLFKKVVLVTSKKVLSSATIIPIMESLVSQGIKELMIIADDVDGEALASFALNKARGLLNIIPVRFPVFGEGKMDQLEDIALRCGTFVIGDKSLKQLRDIPQTETFTASDDVLVAKIDLSKISVIMGKRFCVEADTALE